ncbi:MAG: type IV pilus twitching motility protein PilT [Candidatus Omnitrophica bacterium]|nr:type IV pilus twitching motility protein PilT [Candidatus Omnitrophota bacterium]
MKMDIEKLLRLMVQKQSSDLYLKTGSPVFFRIDGKLMPYGHDVLKDEDTKEIASHLMDDEEEKRFAITHEMDISYSLPDGVRFRVNIFLQRGTVALVFRLIRTNIRSFQELNLPVNVLETLSSEPRGLVLITGVAGSGKSTTLAAMVNFINQRYKKHIVTIEDPVEFMHEDKESIISQREVGMDTKGFHEALRHVIRQSPDVILIGEMRDLETMASAIMAAETGHLVLSTLHTIDATQTVERIINFFPPYQHPQIRMQLSLVLKGVVSLRLLNRKDGSGRIPACEIMVSTPTIRKLILEGKTTQILSAINAGTLFGMQTFNQSLLKLYKEGIVSQEEAMENADNPEELELTMKGIFTGSDTSREGN